MMQLYCPACENVVWLESDAADDVVPCPECRQPIYWLGRRKARPVSDPPAAPDSRVVGTPERITRPSWSPSAPAKEDRADEANWEKPVEQDFSLPCPEPTPRFVPLPYRPEGGVNLARLPLFLGSVLLGGAALGALASALGQVCYLILIYPLAMGLGVAALTVLLGHLCQVRSPLVAGGVALAGGLLVVGAMHVLDHRRTMKLVETAPFKLPAEMVARLKDHPGLSDYLDALASQGLTISGRDSGGLNLGYFGTYLYWTIEGLIVAAIAAFGGSTGARDPFCSSCRHWKEDRFLGTLADGGPEQQKQLQRGDLGAMVCWRPALASGELVLTASVCPRCTRETPIDLKIERNPRGRREPTSQNLPLHMTYPGEALPVLEQLFAAEPQLA